MLSKRQVAELFAVLSRHISPKAELRFESVLDLLVAVVLSAQATDKVVNAVTEELWKVCRTPQDYLSLGEARLQEYCRRIGLYRAKAHSLIGLCRRLNEAFGGEVPDDLESLVSLPGVGLKTAKVVLNIGFGRPVVAVDTHIFRVSHRTGLSKGSTPEQVSEELERIVPARHLKDAHHYLLLHGRYCCQARRPKCEECVICGICEKNI